MVFLCDLLNNDVKKNIDHICFNVVNYAHNEYGAIAVYNPYFIQSDSSIKNPFYIVAHSDAGGLVDSLEEKDLDDFVSEVQKSLHELCDCIILLMCNSAVNGIMDAVSAKITHIPVIANKYIILWDGNLKFSTDEGDPYTLIRAPQTKGWVKMLNSQVIAEELLDTSFKNI